MTVTRRSFLSRTTGKAQPQAGVPAATLPPLAVIVYNRLAFGPRPNELSNFDTLPGGTPEAKLSAWLDVQLNPAALPDSECDAKLSAARIKIRYDAYVDPKDASKNYPAVNEARPLHYVLSIKSDAELNSDLWKLTNFGTRMDGAERFRPFEEVRVATWLRARHSQRQLLEVLVDFWHNHFNVNGPAEVQTHATFPVYDRIIRANAFGRFRDFLEAIGKSTAMMYYLDNYNNKAAGGEGGNENYARELFELHTFGTDNYYKFYDDRTKIPKLPDGVTPAGYIDDDVYEAASCLTGWTIDTKTGNFVFNPNTHYNGVKEVLGQTIRTSGPNGAEGEAKLVYDMLARHPNVARSVCTKLCRRLIADVPPQAVIDAAVVTWMANLDNPNQLREVVRTIVLSEAFRSTWGQKVKRPFEALMAFFRTTNAELPVDQQQVNGKPNEGSFWGSLFWNYAPTGHRLFEWPTPNGYPDTASHWISSNSTLRRWNLPALLSEGWGGNVVVPILEATDLNQTCNQIVDGWIGRLFGYSISAATRELLITFLAYGGKPTEPPKPTPREPDWNNADGVKDRVKAVVQLMAASPEFHNR